MSNRYPGTCSKCGKPVAAGAGECEKVGGKWVVSHATCPAGPDQANPAGDWNTIQKQEGVIAISQGQGYGGTAYKVGQVIRMKDRGPHMVLAARQRYVREDGMSFGVGDEEGYVYSALIRPATEDEAAPLIAAEAARAAARSAEALRTEIAKQICTTGTKPEGDNHPEGDRHSDRQNIHGGGDWFVVGPEAIWYVQNNGADGDMWSANNVLTGGAGAIGWYVPFDAELAAKLAGLPE